MYSVEQAQAELGGDVLDHAAGCGRGCALAVWSMPESEALNWRCPAAGWDLPRCGTGGRGKEAR
jgi:hypothetical protein